MDLSERSLELPVVRKAAEEASHYFVDMFELQEAAGAHLAKLSGAEDAMITSGSAATMSSPPRPAFIGRHTAPSQGLVLYVCRLSR
jgi:hypothetical protein